MAQQWNLEEINHDAVSVPSAGTEITFNFGDNDNAGDTETNRYLHIEEAGAKGMIIISDKDVSFIGANGRTFKVPIAIAAQTPKTYRRGTWRNITFLTTIANTVLDIEVVH